MKNMTRKVYFIFVWITVLHTGAAGQGFDLLDAKTKLENQLEASPFKLTGYLKSDLRLNFASGIDQRQDPFDYRFMGHLQVQSYGVKTQLSVNYSDGRFRRTLRGPAVKLPSYSFIGVSPSYKWGTAHLGFRSMVFSQYTMQGIQFNGVGAELQPGKFRSRIFYGRLQRARPENLDSPQQLDPVFQRWGWGAQMGYENGKDLIMLTIFSAKDDRNSILIPSIRDDVRPQENRVMALHGKKKIGSKIGLEYEYAASLFTRNSLAETIDPASVAWYYTMAGTYETRSSTGLHKALRTQLNLEGTNGSLHLKHERVDPGYRSLGTLAFNNDFEHVTFGGNRKIWKNKISMQGEVGLQRNNLSGFESNTLRRIVGQVQANVQISPVLNSQFQYSNFSTTNILRVSQLPVITEDSLILTQTNQNLSAQLNYVFGDQKQAVVSWNTAYQVFNSIVNDEVNEMQLNSLFMSTLSHQYQFFAKNTSLGNSLLYQSNQNFFGQFWTLSPSHTLQKKMFDRKLELQLQLSNVFFFQNNEFQRHVFSARTQSKFNINDTQTAGLQLTFVKQSPGAALSNLPDFNELAVFFTYQYRF